MDAYVIVATKNRAKETFVLLDYLARQTHAPALTVLIGSEPNDVQGLDAHPMVLEGRATVLLSAVGSTIQRNAGLDAVAAVLPADAAQRDDWFVVFFDDDFRPATTWLENAKMAFQADRSVVGITGCLLADGIHTEFGVPETDVASYLDGSKAKMPNWSNTGGRRIIDGLYGCNMAVRGLAAVNERFDERLPMYAWQEDADFTARTRRHGDLILLPECIGVHMGASSGRTSGVRFGYSQIANPIFLARKGTMTWRRALTLMSRNILSNVAKTVQQNRIKDFSGRLRGNIRAFAHLFLGRLDPQHIQRM